MKIHLIAICGTGMGSLAGLLKEAGHDVRGSDRAFYPPMSKCLHEWGITTMHGFDPAHITDDLDLVVVGNACRKDNPEAVEALNRGIQIASFPETLSKWFIRDRQSIVVAGTHGKTTTVSILSYLLTQLGMDPSYLIGGIPNNTGKSFRLGKSKLFVVEGDEYDSAFFDKRPKFIHYQPDILVLTSLEYDHADIYPDMKSYRSAFSDLISLLDQQAVLVACFDCTEVKKLAAQAKCRVLSYGFGADVDWRASEFTDGEYGAGFKLTVKGSPAGMINLPLSGRHNVTNTLAVLTVVDILGHKPEIAAGHLSGFLGVARRMQVRGVISGVTVIDDFAHHPTEVAETLLAARMRYPRAHLVAVFEPRSNSSRRNLFQERYKTSFQHADSVFLVPPYNQDQIDPEMRFDSASIVQTLLQQGKNARLCWDANQIVVELSGQLKEGSVVVIMSNGAFDDIHEKLIQALSMREAGLS